MKVKQFLLTSMLLFLVAACKSTKKINTAVVKKDTSVVIQLPLKLPEKIQTIDSLSMGKLIYDKINTNKIVCDWFSAKIKLDYNDNSGDNEDATAYIRLKKDSLIWISLAGTLGIEGFRVLITKDSIFLMNKLKKQIQKRPIAYLKTITEFPFDFLTLQDLILGNPIFFVDNIIAYKQFEGTIQATANGLLFKNFITIDTVTNQIKESKLEDINLQNSRTCNITFLDYEQGNGKVFATNRDIEITENYKLDIHLRFKQYDFNKQQSFPFAIPKTYKVN